MSETRYLLRISAVSLRNMAHYSGYSDVLIVADMFFFDSKFMNIFARLATKIAHSFGVY